MTENIESFTNLERKPQDVEAELQEIPYVLQYTSAICRMSLQ